MDNTPIPRFHKITTKSFMTSWFLVSYNKYYLIVYHKHDKFLFDISQIKKDKYYCLLCKDIVPNYILLQVSILDKKIITFGDQNQIKIHTKTHIATYFPTWNSLFISNKIYREKIVKLFLDNSFIVNEVIVSEI